jgi:hypothetical protein
MFVVYRQKNSPFPFAGLSRAFNSWRISGSHVPELLHRVGGFHRLPFILPYSGLGSLRFRILPKNVIDDPLLRRWITHCNTYHGGICSYQSEESQLWATGRTALKVIDYRSSKVIVAPQDAEYVALSYVWGRLSNYDIADGALHSGTTTDSLVDLPETIKDAIKVTLELGHYFLWCDKWIEFI